MYALKEVFFVICVYPADCTDFSNNGLGAVTPMSCTVTETLNGEWELTLEHEIDERGIRRVLIFIDHALLYGRVLRRVRVYGSAFSVSVFPGQHVRHRPRRGALLHGVLPPSHQSESSRSSSSPSNSASKSGSSAARGSSVSVPVVLSLTARDKSTSFATAAK